METGRIVSWQKKEGDELAEGDVLCEIETDKATMGFETPEEGFLAKIVIPEDTRGVPIGKLLCIIVDSKDKVAAFKNFKDDGATVKPPPPAPAPASPPPAAPAAAPPPPPPPSAAAPPPPAAAHPGGHVSATPFARKLAAERGVDISGVAGTGPGGRILAADLARAPAGAAAPAAAGAAAARPAIPSTPGAAYTDIPLTGMRSTIAKRLTESKSTIPHYYLTAEINIDALLK
ncbi:e3 binding domain protein [Cooperia oncophora]